jgi:hypothetical protein
MSKTLSPNKDLRKMLDDLTDQGFEVSKRGGHIKVRNPRMDSGAVVFIPSTPRGGSVTRKNMLTVLRKIGYSPVSARY